MKHVFRVDLNVKEGFCPKQVKCHINVGFMQVQQHIAG